MSQTGAVVLLQSVLARHTTHTPFIVSQTGAAAPQSELWRQATHSLRAVSHSGVAPPQPELLVQPARHVKSCGEQIGRAEPQSEFERHSTQV